MKQWYLKLLKLQKPYDCLREIGSLAGLIALFGLIIAWIADRWMTASPAIGWTLIILAACVGIGSLVFLIRYDLKTMKKRMQYWDEQIQRQKELESSEN